MYSSVKKVSVVIPFYNRHGLLFEALDSVLAQDDPPDEVIVVDDGSTDRGVDLVARRFPSVRLIKQSNQGAAAARNRGAMAAQSEWVAFLDSDDLWLPDHVSETKRILRAFPEADLVSTSHRQVRSSAPELVISRLPCSTPRRIRYLAEAIRNPGIVWTSSASVRREALREVGGFRSFQTGEDTDLWVRLSLRRTIAVSDRVTALYRRGSGGVIESLEARSFSAPLPSSIEDLHPCCQVLMNELATLEPDKDAQRQLILAFLDHLAERSALQAFVKGNFLRFRAAYRLRAGTATGRKGALGLLALLPASVLPVAHWLYRLTRAGSRKGRMGPTLR